MLKDLSSSDRLRLMKFVCSFAWADLEIRPEERAFVGRLVSGLSLDPDEQRQVQRWLERPPAAESLDPTRIPVEHRRLFIEAAEGMIASDGRITSEESENLAVFKQLLG